MKLCHLQRPVLCLVAQLCPTLCDPIDCSLPGSSVHGDPPGKNIVMGCHAILQGVFPTQVSPGKPKNTGVGSISLLLGIFLTQESNQGLLHCIWILYQLSYQESLHTHTHTHTHTHLITLHGLWGLSSPTRN